MVSFKVHDKVLCINMSRGAKWVKGTIVERLGVNVFRVHIHEFDVVWKRHANQMLLRNIADDINTQTQVAISNDLPITSSVDHSRFGDHLPSNDEVPNDCSNNYGSNHSVGSRRSERVRKQPTRFIEEYE